MRNIGEIFVADLKNATKSAVGVVVLVGLVVVPAMYAWFNILGGWDPYENTDGLKIAVANADEGYSSDLVPVDLNIGDSVVAALRANDQFAWEFVSEDEAVESVRSGSCYAAIVIPESFSADMMTLFSTDIKHSDIVYYSNQKENAIAPRVTDKGASAVQASIDETFASTVDEVGLKVISQLITFMDGDAMSSYAATLSRNLEYLEADLDNAADQATAFSALLVSTSSLVQTTSGIMGDSGAASASSRSAIDEASAGLANVGDALSEATAVADEALAQSGESFDVIARGIDKALESAEKPAGEVAGDLKKASDDLQRLSDNLVQVRDAIRDIEDANASPTPEDTAANKETIEKFDRAIRSLDSLKKGIDGLSHDVGKTLETAAEDRRDVESLLGQARESLSGIRTDYESGLSYQAETLRSTLSSVRYSAERVSGDVGYVLSSLTGVSNALAGDLDGTRVALDQAGDALKRASAKLKAQREELAEALSVGDLEQVKRIVGSDPEGMASFLSSPVSIDRHSVYGIANYGSSMAAFYTVLSLWVGSIILVAMMKVEVPERRIAALGSDVRLHQRYLGRFCIFAVLAFLQSTFVCLGDLLFLGIQCEHPLLFMLAGWAVALVFSFLVYTLVVSFGDIGKAVAVVLLVMQVAGSGGTFPIEMTAPFFQAVYPFLPFTHGIAAMHACIGGIYGSEYAVQIGQLLLFLVPALLLGLVLRKPVIKLNDFVIEKLEETKIM